MIRCPVHDCVHEENEPCPMLGTGSDSGYVTGLPTDSVHAKNGDCEMHRKVKEHEKKRVLAEGGKWDDTLQRAKD